MKNTAEISSDGVNVYVTSVIRAGTAGKVILTCMNLLVLTAYILILSSIEEKEAGKFIIPAVLMFIVLIFFPWRYWFWNFYGKENITINTKTITHYNDYGILLTKPKTMEHRQLKTSYEAVKEFDGKEFGRLTFWTYDSETNLPKPAYQTSVLISKADIDNICTQISGVYEKEFQEKHLFLYSEN